MSKSAWIFPGQGSQKVGMIADLQTNEAAQARLAEAGEILGWSVAELTGPDDDEAKLSQTLYTQPCLYTIESILVDALLAQGKQPDFLAGHSLGEYVALYAAGVFDFATGLKLVKQRATLMSVATGGTMMALIGFDRAELDTAIAKTPDVVLANDNSDGQVVISGTPAAVQTIADSIKTKRAISLNVSGAFHSPMMEEASHTFDALLQDVTVQDANIPVLSNVDPTPATDADILKKRLSQQITGSVRWREIMATLSESEVSTVVEVGPGVVLTGLFKRAYRAIARQNIANIADCA